jgi:hypothetical protein
MAKITIDIINPIVDLIKNIRATSNSCQTVYEFDIEGTPHGQIKVDIERVNNLVEDYDTAQINLQGLFVTSNYPTHTHTLRGTGKAGFKLAIGNAEKVIIQKGIGSCNETKITVTDLSTGQSETRSFPRCRPASRCVDSPAPPPSSPVFDSSTNVLIKFDKSGSMDGTLAPLQTMRDTLLKDALLPYYNNDESVYYNKVKIEEVQLNHYTSGMYEDPYAMLNYDNKNVAGKVISLVFMDEADEFAYEGMTINDPPLPKHISSLATFRNRLDNFPANYYKGVLFQVATPDVYGEMVAFRAYIEAVKNGTGSYSGTNGLSDKPEVSIKLDITPSSTPQYYKDLIINSLNELGFDL